jgi:hypothetical protein
MKWLNTIQDKDGSTISGNAMPVGGGTFTGTAKAQSNTSYTTAQLRNVRFKQGPQDTTNFTTAELAPGEIGFIYE